MRIKNRLLNYIKIIFSALLFTLIITFPVMSYSPYLDQAKEIYHLNSLKCETCHIGKNLNSYGKDFKNTIKIQKDITKTFLELNNLDSDEDGVSNYDEIIANFNPGDKFSYPKNEKKK